MVSCPQPDAAGRPHGGSSRIMTAATPRVGAIPRINVLGVGVSAVDMKAAVAEIERWIADGRREYVCVTGMHGVVESYRAPALRRIHNRAGLVTPDGMPMVWLLWWHGHRRADRVCGTELMAATVAQTTRPRYRDRRPHFAAVPRAHPGRRCPDRRRNQRQRRQYRLGRA
jgi:hypothetical protein